MAQRGKAVLSRADSTTAGRGDETTVSASWQAWPGLAGVAFAAFVAIDLLLRGGRIAYRNAERLLCL